jgi:superoxide dismutase, Fe-Mn family
MNRRSFVAVTGAAVAGSVLSPTRSEAAALGLGLELPALPYAPEALEPHIDAVTMGIHHGKHHQAYINNLKLALEGASIAQTDAVALVSDLGAVPEAARMAVRNNAGGHVNHAWFWNWMAPAGSGPAGPEGKLAAAIQSTFGSIEDFKKAFGEAGTKRFGSGWAWLIQKADGKLAVVSTPNQDNPLMKGVVPDSDLGQAAAGAGCVGARLLPEVHEQAAGLHRGVVECGELEGGGVRGMRGDF